MQYTTIIKGIGSLVLLVLLTACDLEDGTQKQDQLVAKAFNKSLFQSELKDLITEDTSPKDSAQIANAYIDQWVREAVLMHEAEKYVPKDLNIDELVRDYRASLIRHNYEKLLVELNLDSTIVTSELENYYKDNKEQYKLKQPILQCQFIKLKKPVEQWNEVKNWWKSDKEEDYTKLVDYCNRNAELYLLNDNIWYDLEDISQHMPKGKLTSGNYRSNKDLSTDDDEYEYLLRIYKTESKGNYPPLASIAEHAKKVILHKRKIALLERKKAEMYEVATSQNRIKIER